VSIVKHKDDIEFKVDDQGIGVPKSEQQQLFTKFYRASNARKQRPDGTGIGLFMAKKVIVAHGGSIIFATHEGKGSTFGFKLPLTATLLSKSVRTEATPQPVR
jgi:signal transduction histidine kinase